MNILPPLSVASYEAAAKAARLALPVLIKKGEVSYAYFLDLRATEWEKIVKESRDGG